MSDKPEKCSCHDLADDTKPRFAGIHDLADDTKPRFAGIASRIQSWALLCVIVYLVWSTNEFMRVKNELNMLKMRQENLGCTGHDSIKETADIEQAKVVKELQYKICKTQGHPATVVHTRGKRSTGNTCPCNCKSVKKCRGRRGRPGRRGRRGTKGDPGEQGPVGPQGQKGEKGPVREKLVYAAHYTSKLQNLQLSGIYSEDRGELEAWGGRYMYQKALYINKKKNQVLKFLDETQLPDEYTSPLHRQYDGTFRTRIRGLYLLYMNILSVVYSDRHRINLEVDGVGKLQCQTSLDLFYDRKKTETIYTEEDQYTSAPTKTCGVTGVFYLNKDSVISITIATPSSGVNIQRYTNFGAVLLSPA